MSTVAEGVFLRAPTIDDLDRQFDASRAGLLRLCTSLVGPHEADDVVHDVYMVARQRLGQLNEPAALGAWLKRIAVNRCYDRHRRVRRLRERLPMMRPGLPEDRDPALIDLVERLPPRQRTILVLHYAYGYSLHEIAELLSLTHVNVRTIIARTRRSLLEAWQENGS